MNCGTRAGPGDHYFDIADVYGDEPGLSETLLGTRLDRAVMM